MRVTTCNTGLLKWTFVIITVHYLGHVVSATGVKPDSHKMEVESQYPVLTNTKEQKQFLALMN